MNWIKYNPKGVNLPRSHKPVLVLIEGWKEEHPLICMGYLRYYGRNDHQWTVPGANIPHLLEREILYWCDMLDCIDFKDLFSRYNNVYQYHL